ncbi:MAG: 7-carboxy-7-deazaguanine synthase QueE [Bacteroidota bacterium]
MDKTADILLAEGRLLPVMEEFYTLQGEGFNTGQAAYFIRIGGCDVGCSWCDIKESWDARLYPPVDTNGVISRAVEFPGKAVVITGGEPLNYNLNYLSQGLRQHHIKIFIETSGSRPLSGDPDWLCLSPKKSSPPLDKICIKADELKVIILDETDLGWAEENKERVRPGCLLYLQPEWSRRNTILPRIISYIKEHPQWRVSLQSHKYMRIP